MQKYVKLIDGCKKKSTNKINKMKNSFLLIALFIAIADGIFAQINLPEWPIVPQPLGNNGTIPANRRNAQRVRMNTQVPHFVAQIPNTLSVNAGPAQAGFDNCGKMIFYVLHDGTKAKNHLNIFRQDGTELLGQTVNAPGLDGFYTDQEIQIALVPGTTNEWYIIYNKTTFKSNNNVVCPYYPGNVLFTRIKITNGVLSIVGAKDQVLQVNGSTKTYSFGKAISPINNNGTQHFLYLYRRSKQGTEKDKIYIDRFKVNNAGISFDCSSNAIQDTYWGDCDGAGTISGSPIEISNDGSRIAVNSRKQDYGGKIYIFQSTSFCNSNPTTLTLSSLTVIDALPNYAGQKYLVNWIQKVSGIEFSPNGQYLYIAGGGYVQGGYSNLSYIGQIDLNNPNSIRLQVQETPNYNQSEGRGEMWNDGTDTKYLESHMIMSIEKSFDGNLYFNKTNEERLFVLPNPNSQLSVNLTPHDIDFSTTPNAPNIPVQGYPNILPDQIDGHNYLVGSINVIASSPNYSPCLWSNSIQLVGTPSGGTWSGSTLVSSNGIFNPSITGVYNIAYTTQGCSDVIQIQVKECEGVYKYCCPGKNLVTNGDFESGNNGVTSQYTYNPSTSPSATIPGQYSIVNGQEAFAISSGWVVQDPSSCPNTTGKFMVVNGKTCGTGKKVIWEQSFTVTDWGKYEFCASFKNMKQCNFDIKPKIEIQFSIPQIGNVTETIDVGSGACDWKNIVKHVWNWGYGTTLNIKILLDETGCGDGNDIALDNIALIETPLMPDNLTKFEKIEVPDIDGVFFNIIAFSPPIPSTFKNCGIYYSVVQQDKNTKVNLTGSGIENPSGWWPLPNYQTQINFPGYDGTSGPPNPASGSVLLPFNNVTSLPAGKFKYEYRYKIGRAVYCDCFGWNQKAWIYDPTGNGFRIIDETTQQVIKTGTIPNKK